MSASKLDRRHFLRSGASAIGAAAIVAPRIARAQGFKSANDRPRVAVVGCGSRWSQKATIADGPYGLGKEFPKFSDIVMVCDVDDHRVERAQGLVKGWLGQKPDGASDYRKVLDRDDIDIVHISTPDHWHAKIAIEAMLAGKHLYCEKPMTLTIGEGRLLCDVQKQTGRIVQIGTQQRSIPHMVKAIAMIREGRLGTIQRVQCAVGGGPTSPKLPVAVPPKHFDWDRWQGPVAETDYRYLAGARNEMKSWSRTHYEFRWWYEYSGGKLTDWGAHHVDIATWGMGKTETGPVAVDPVMVKHPVEFKDGRPLSNDCYNTATQFNIKATYADGMELTIRHDTDNGILFEGTKGRVFVNRGRLVGAPVEALSENPLPADAMSRVYGGELTDHLANFFSGVANNRSPISDPSSHHRALSTCHLASIAARLGRKIQWDPESETVEGDPLAQAMVDPPKRIGYEIER